MILTGSTSTELVKSSIQEVLDNGVDIKRWGGTMQKDLSRPASKDNPQNYEHPMREVNGAIFELTNPAANFTDIGTTVFITLREQLDHMIGDNPGLVARFSKRYQTWLDKDGKFPYSYGEAFDTQIRSVVRKLRDNPNSRKACIPVWRPGEDTELENPGCNVFFQFTVNEDGKLDMTTFNRSQDLLYGLTENIFMFTTWQNEIALQLGVDVGSYRTLTSNAHLYMDYGDKLTDALETPDVYDTSSPALAQVPFSNVRNHIIATDVCIMKEEWDDVDLHLDHIWEIDPYWSAWEAAMASEWAVKCKDPDVAEYFSKYFGDFPWADNVLQRVNKLWKKVEA